MRREVKQFTFPQGSSDAFCLHTAVLDLRLWYFSDLLICPSKASSLEVLGPQFTLLARNGETEALSNVKWHFWPFFRGKANSHPGRLPQTMLYHQQENLQIRSFPVLLEGNVPLVKWTKTVYFQTSKKEIYIYIYKLYTREVWPSNCVWWPD